MTEQTATGVLSRRAFGRTATLAGMGVTAAAILGSAENAEAAPTDADILNFALNLEYLEAEFYTKATTGKTIAELGIGTNGTGTKGATTGGRLINFGSSTRKIMMEIAENERNHVAFLRS